MNIAKKSIYSTTTGSKRKKSRYLQQAYIRLTRKSDRNFIQKLNALKKKNTKEKPIILY